MHKVYEKNRDRLISAAKEMGLLSACTEHFLREYCKNGYEGQNVIYESLTRLAIEAAVKDINPSLKVRQMPLDSAYDAEILSGGTRVKIEGKTRLVSSTHYPTLDVSYEKGDMLEEQRGLLFVLCIGDWEWSIWDLGEYTPKTGTWTHKKYTADNRKNWTVTEQCFQFEKNKAKYSGGFRRDG